MASTTVNVDNFKRAETDTMISRILPIIGGLGTFHHDRELAPLDRQPVIRQNRDTLYSVAIVELAGGEVALNVPDLGDRYISVMVINQDHYINRVYHRAGSYRQLMKRSARADRERPTSRLRSSTFQGRVMS